MGAVIVQHAALWADQRQRETTGAIELKSAGEIHFEIGLGKGSAELRHKRRAASHSFVDRIARRLLEILESDPRRDLG